MKPKSVHKEWSKPVPIIGVHSTSMFHRSTFARRGPLDEHLGFGEDCEIWLRRRLVHGYAMQYTDPAAASGRVHGAQPGAAHAGAGAPARGRPKAHAPGTLHSRRHRRPLTAATPPLPPRRPGKRCRL